MVAEYIFFHTYADTCVHHQETIKTQRARLKADADAYAIEVKTIEAEDAQEASAVLGIDTPVRSAESEKAWKSLSDMHDARINHTKRMQRLDDIQELVANAAAPV
eukprot:4957923-Karenia_brevis.AAC.1